MGSQPPTPEPPAYRILDAVQECSGLVVLVDVQGEQAWLRPPEGELTRELAEQLIEEQHVRVQGRWVG